MSNFINKPKWFMNRENKFRKYQSNEIQINAKLNNKYMSHKIFKNI